MPRGTRPTKREVEQAEEAPAEGIAEDSSEPEDEEAAEAQSNGKRKRPSKRYGKLVDVDELAQMEPVELPPTRFGVGRGVDDHTKKVIDFLKANPGKVYPIGEYGSPAVASGVWLDNRIKFAHRASGNTHPETGKPLQTRYAVCVPDNQDYKEYEIG